METEEDTSTYVKQWSGLAVANIFLAGLANLIILGTWYNIFTDRSDTMFLGLLMIPLFLLTWFYAFLLLGAVNIFRNRYKLKEKFMNQSLILFIVILISFLLL